MKAITGTEAAAGAPCVAGVPAAPATLDLPGKLAALRRIALAVVRPSGPSEKALLHELLAELTQALPAAGALVAVFGNDSRTTLRTLAVRLDGQALPDFEYPVRGSPCERVVGAQFRYTARGVLAEVDPQSPFAEAGLDAYAAFPLNDSQGVPVGVLAALGREPIAGGDAGHAEVVLKVVAGRLAGELERRQALNVLRDAALAVSSARGETIFDELARMLARTLEVEFAFIARHEPSDPEHLHMVALHSDGRVLEGLRYAIGPTPCRTVLGQQFRAYPRDLAALFPDDPDVLDKGAESYAGLPLTGTGGEPLGVIAVGSRRPLQDVGHIEAMLKIFAVRAAAEIERLRALEALRRSEASYRTIFDSAESAIYVHDWDSFALIDANRRACEEHGRSREELLAAHPSELMGGDEPYDLEHALQRLQQARLGRCAPFEWQVRVKDGSVHWWEIHLKPAQLDGRPCILAFTHDITARKLVEQQLRASEEQYRAIFNASADALILWDNRFQRVDVNPAFERLYGWTREEVIGRSFEIFSSAAEHVEPRRELVRRALAGESCHAELEGVNRAGQRIVTEISTVPFQHRGQPHVLAIVRDITERKAAEAQLRASEEQYRAIFNASADALMLWDSSLKRVDVNPAHQKIFGYAREDVVGRGFEGLDWPQELVQPRLEMVRRALGGDASRVELMAQRKSGERIVTELRTIPFQHRGEPHVLQIARDITERKQAEAQLRAREEQYRGIFDGSVDPMVLWSSRLEVADVNDAFVRVTGLRREQVIGRHWSERPDVDDMRKLVPHIEAALAGRAALVVERVHHAGEGLIDMELRYLPVRIGGEPFALGIARDITERKAAEAQLREREEQYRIIFDGSADAMILWNDELRVADVNQVYLRWTGYTRQDVIEMKHLQQLDADDIARRAALVRQALQGHEGQMESIVRRRDGSQFDIELRYVPMRFAGKPMALAIGRDISARRAVEAERQQLEAQLRQAQKMEAIGQLTGGIAHDFNNILTTVLGYVAMAEERAQARGDDDKLLRQLGQARAASERARDLVAQMLAFARRQSGSRQPLSLAELVRESMELLRSTLPSSVVLDAEGLEASLPDVEADAVQLGQVLMNLVINARDAVGGTGHVRVALRERSIADGGSGWRCRSCGHVAPRGRWVELSVADDGSGIEPQTLQRMFDPFFTTKPTGRGTGMGLAMVHGIVHQHGGHIGVDTRLGEGSTFRVLLPALATPVRRGDAPGQDAMPAGTTGPPAAPDLSGRVLVVEDDVQAGDFLRDRLEAWGLDVVLQRDARDALTWLEDPTQHVDLLVTDLTMPHLSGLQLARLATERRRALPVLLVSGDLAAAGDQARAAAGVRFTLAKPLEPAALRRVLEQALPPSS